MGPISYPSPTADPLQYQRHLFVHISQHCPSPGAPPLESVDVRQIYDKFPEKKGGLRELYDRGPPHAFFLVKFWVSSPPKTKVLLKPMASQKRPLDLRERVPAPARSAWALAVFMARSVSPLSNKERHGICPWLGMGKTGVGLQA